MFWTGFVVGIAASIVAHFATGLAMFFVHDHHQRSAFMAHLSPSQREDLREFESARGNWHEFRDMLLRS
jgi:hypothetical protein